MQSLVSEYLKSIGFRCKYTHDSYYSTISMHFLMTSWKTSIKIGSAHILHPFLWVSKHKQVDRTQVLRHVWVASLGKIKKPLPWMSSGVILGRSWHYHENWANILLGGGFNPFETYKSKWESSPNRGENRKKWNHHPDQKSLIWIQGHFGGDFPYETKLPFWGELGRGR